MAGLFRRIMATREEIAAPRPGDDVVPHAHVVMDRAMSLGGTPPQVWPWLAQLGKQRAGWYLPRWAERPIPRRRRALRHIETRSQQLVVGDIVPDYGGAHETFEVVEADPPRTLVYRSRRGHTDLSWSITLSPVPDGTRVHFRLRLGSVKHPAVAERLGVCSTR